MKTISSREFKNGRTFVKAVNVTYLYHIGVEVYYSQGLYHVRAFNHVNNSSVSDKLAWDTFKNLKDANKRFYELLKIYRK